MKYRTLAELVEVQRDLNQYCLYPETRTDLIWAIAAELGEFAQATKTNWCWWKRYGKDFQNADRADLVMKLADILCFLLTGILMDPNAKPNDFNYHWSTKLEKYSEFEIFQWLRLWEINDGDPALLLSAAVRGLITIARQAGFTREEFESAYLEKVAVNKQRFTKTKPETSPNETWLYLVAMPDMSKSFLSVEGFKVRVYGEEKLADGQNPEDAAEALIKKFGCSVAIVDRSINSDETVNAKVIYVIDSSMEPAMASRP